MHQQKRITFDFYRPVCRIDGQLVPFRDLLDEVAALAANQTRNVRWNSGYIRADIPAQNQLVLSKIRMIGLPRKMSLQGSVSDIPLRADEGLSEHSVAIYSPSNNVLVHQRSHYSVGISALAFYLKQKTSSNDVSLDPILRLDAYKKLGQLRDVFRMEVSVAAAPSTMTASTDDHGVFGANDIMRETGMPSLHIVGTTGRGGVSNVKAAKRWLKDLLRLRNDQEVTATMIRVSGSNPEGEELALDLIADRMYSIQDVVWETTSRSVPHDVAFAAARDALRERAEEL